MTHQAEIETRRMLRLPDVLARTGMSRSWVYREIDAGRFPKPEKMGRAIRWDSKAIDAYLASILGRVSAQLPLFLSQQEPEGAGDAS